MKTQNGRIVVETINVVNVYILLRSLLRCLMIDSSYEDTSIFIFHVLVFAGYIIFPYN